MTEKLARMFIRDLTILDAAYFDDFYGPVGASWQVDVELTGYRDDHGMLYDFSPCKKTIKRTIDARFDHTLITPEGPNRAVAALEYECPPEAVSRIPGSSFTVSGLETAIKTAVEAEFREQGRDNVVAVDVDLREVVFPDDKPWYRYTHGLKHHDGNCQRLWHGHRNAIDVTVNGRPDPELERYFADLFFNAHIAFAENIQGGKKLEVGRRQVQHEHLEVQYESTQGKFWARIPGRNVVVVPVEPTVENLAGFVLDEAARRRSGSLEVRVYEGINKGSRLNRIQPASRG